MFSKTLLIVTLLQICVAIILSLGAEGVESSCTIGLPQNEIFQKCRKKRKAELIEKRNLYKLKKIGRSLNKEFDNPAHVLDMSTNQFVSFTLNDPFTRHHMQLYTQGKAFAESLSKSLPSLGQPINSFDDYRKINEHFLNKIEAMGGKPFRIPSKHELFQDVVTYWQCDRVFTEQRLAGVNPMALQQITFDTNVGLNWNYLKASNLNPSFDFQKAVEEALGKTTTFKKAVLKGLVYALRYPLGDNISNVDLDFMEPDTNRKVQPFNSPIALFVFKKKEAQLVPVAIQEDCKPGSRVDTPNDGPFWSRAKANVQVTDMTYSQIVDHLVKVHFLLGPLCVLLQRYLSEAHPLHQMLKFHCRGLAATNNLGAPSLFSQNKTTDKLNAFGSKGSNELLVNAYKKFGWEQTDFLGNLKKRGVNNQKTLPYFPYRDDGSVVYEVIKKMVKEYVDSSYKTDQDVSEDTELRAFLNEASQKVRRFPATVTTKKKLVNMLTRWISQGSLQHAAVSYPVINYSTFTPLGPSKLYSDNRISEVFGYHNFSNGHISAFQSVLGLVLSALRYDSLFDYSSELEDPVARQVVYKHHCKLVNEVQPLLEQRNKERFRNGYLTYPYLIPRWVPNGVQA